MTLSDADKNDILMSTVAAMKAHVAVSQAAIFGIKPNGDGELAGSGSFVLIDDAVYGLTAAHVLTDRHSRGEGVAHSVSNGTSPRIIVGPIPCVGPPSDLGCFKVQDSVAGGLPGYVTLAQFADPTSLKGDILFVQGFSGDKSHGVVDGIASDATPYGTFEGTSTYEWFDPRMHIAVEYTPEGAQDELGRSAWLPSAHGMSGSLLWKTNRMMRPDGWTPDVAEIVGLITTWDQDARSLVATRSWAVRQFLLQSLAVMTSAGGWRPPPPSAPRAPAPRSRSRSTPDRRRPRPARVGRHHRHRHYRVLECPLVGVLASHRPTRSDHRSTLTAAALDHQHGGS